MSVRMISRVWEHSEARGTELLVLLALADHANDDGECWPGQDRLAKKARISRRTVQRHLDALEERGEISRIVRRGGHGVTNLYRISMCQSDASPDVTSVTSDVTNGDAPDVTPIGARTVSQPSVEPSGRTKRKKKLPPDWMPSEETREWARENYPEHAKVATVEAFRDHAEDKGRVFGNPDAAFKNWIRNEAKWARGGKSEPARTYLGGPG